jgi:hypothetical protein
MNIVSWVAQWLHKNGGCTGYVPEFAADSWNIRLGIGSDEFNPFGMLCSKCSCLPVAIVVYNLPP